ncbi:MAG TPA: sugar transferase [Gemmataceae bacterium]|jgi:lipopolysaccharide/colanic/teichoic acid biosynthesis glycosyltransferase
MAAPVPGYFRVKRGLDCVLAAVLLVASAPVVLAAMAVVRLTSRGPAVYTQTRVGYGGRPFTIYKIRTMVDNCESLTGPRWCVPGDPRVTPVGGWLRRLHIDELPQLLNVLKGEMSLVGPRPERPEFVTKLVREIPNYDGRHAVLPGITGLAQIHLPPDTEVAHVERKLTYDLYYARHIGLRLDLSILVGTALQVFGVPARVARAIVPVRREAWADVEPVQSWSKAA